MFNEYLPKKDISLFDRAHNISYIWVISPYLYPIFSSPATIPECIVISREKSDFKSTRVNAAKALQIEKFISYYLKISSM